MFGKALCHCQQNEMFYQSLYEQNKKKIYKKIKKKKKKKRKGDYGEKNGTITGGRRLRSNFYFIESIFQVGAF